MSDIKLYFFSSGLLKTKKHFLEMNRGYNEDIDIPVPFFLIKHPKANIIFDTGIAEEVINNSNEHWGKVVETYEPVMTEDEFVVNQLHKADLGVEDIDIVIMSHLHLDHSGGIGKFPNASYIVQRKELEWAYVPDFYQKAAYIRKDFDRDVDWIFLYGEEDEGYDVLGDGSVKIIFTPGHTPGHQSIQVDLEEAGKFVLAADSCYTDDTLKEDIIPGLVWNSSAAVKSINKLRYLQKYHGVKIVTGHDPAAWERYLKAPKFYK